MPMLVLVSRPVNFDSVIMSLSLLNLDTWQDHFMKVLLPSIQQLLPRVNLSR